MFKSSMLSLGLVAHWKKSSLLAMSNCLLQIGGKKNENEEATRVAAVVMEMRSMKLWFTA